MVKILAFYDAPFGCYAADRRTDGQTDRRTDRIPKFNTSLIGRGKKLIYLQIYYQILLKIQTTVNLIKIGKLMLMVTLKTNFPQMITLIKRQDFLK